MDILQNMTSVLAHRGPDDEGFYFDKNVGLGHRRLSILDLTSAGKQPMVSADRRYAIVFNGEIYNFRDLHRQYLADVKLRSQSDTEVLLYLLARYGQEALPWLRGMFAFAFWDSAKAELLLARDPFGKKPLYYHYNSSLQLFCFASEVKGLLQHPAVSKNLDHQAIAKYFLFEYVPSPASGFKDIKQVSMGSFMKVSAQGIKMVRWWQPKFLPKMTVSLGKATEQFDRKLAQAVERRLIADVPVGLLLSGGLDSSTILWYMRQVTSAPLHSFSVAFPEQSFDESTFAKKVARMFKTQHHEIPFSLDQFYFSLRELISHVDIPFADSSLLPTYLVSKAAKEHITVALDGDGSDELLGGYGTFAAAEMAEYFSWLPPRLISALYQLAQHLPTRHTYFSWDFKLKAFLKGLPYSLPRRNQVWLGSFSEIELRQLLAPSWQTQIEHVFDDIDQVTSEISNLSNFDAISRLTIEHYLPNDILVKLDRASMYASLEARTPFLDVDVAEFVMQLPIKYKRNKYLLRRLMANRLPAEIVERKKQGFAVPLGQWLRGPLFEFAQRVLDPKVLKSDGILQPHYVTNLLNIHKSGKADLRKQLWALIMFQLWYNQWVMHRESPL